MKPVVPPHKGAPWGLYVLVAVCGLVVSIEDGWAVGVTTSALLGVVLASGLLVAEAISTVSSRTRTAPKLWLAVQFAIVATANGLCLAIGAIEAAIRMAAFSAIIVAVPFVVVSAVQALRRIAAR